MDEIKCYFDISIGEQSCGRIIFKLFKDKCPKTCENFRALCTGELGISKITGKPLHYKGSPFHRVVRNFMIQGGDITDGNGKGGDSIYGGQFEDENLHLAHDEPYLLSMANRGPDTNKSQFFITTNEAPHLDGKHVVFGRVVSGLDTVLKVERQEVDSRARPIKQIIIKDCGILHTDDSSQSKPQLDSNAINSQPLDTKVDTKKTVGRKRKLSTTSSQSSGTCAQKVSSRPTRGRSRSISCSSTSSSTSSSNSLSSARSKSRSRTKVKSRTRRVSPCSTSTSSISSTSTSSSNSTGSSDSESSHSSVTSGSSHTGTDTSRDTCSTSNSRSRRRGRKTNRRLEPTRKLGDFSVNNLHNPTRKNDSFETKHFDEEKEDSYVNPYYKCSIKADEIPEVPVNRFLMRGPITNNKDIKKNSNLPMKREDDEEIIDADNEDDDSPMSIHVDLSKFEDIPDENELDNDGAAVITSGSTNTLRSQVKPTEAFVSKSGRIMRGRGKFKFRTPSPTNSSSRRQDTPPERRRRRWSPSRSRRRFSRSDKKDRWVSEYRSRSRSRSRSRERSSPSYSHRSYSHSTRSSKRDTYKGERLLPHHDDYKDDERVVDRSSPLISSSSSRLKSK